MTNEGRWIIGAALIAVGLLLAPRPAGAFPSSCSDSVLGDWATATCDPDNDSTDVCRTEGSPSKYVCDEFSDGYDQIVYAYSNSSTGDSIVFGESDGDLFCCFLEDSPLPLVIVTADGDDTVCLDDSHNDCDDWEDVLDPDPSFGDGYWWNQTIVRTQDGNDFIRGSDYDDSNVCDETTGDWCDDIYPGSCDETNPLNFGDVVYGGDGPDRLSAPGQDDTCNHELWGEGGNDYLLGSGADDYLHGGGGGNVIRGQGGDDDLIGGELSDWLNGGDGEDTLLGSNGDDTLCGATFTDGEEDDLNGNNGTDYCSTNEDSEDSMTSCEPAGGYRQCPAAPW